MTNLGFQKSLAATFIGLTTASLELWGLGTGIKNLTVSTGILGATAAVASDEFYAKTESIHTAVSTFIGGMGIVAGVISIALKPQDGLAMGIDLIGCGIKKLIGNAVIVPVITNEIHEYFGSYDDQIIFTGHSNDFDMSL
ncbi:MAG: hypothetical protein ACK4OM_05290 [Alphaproteobacteria bacterium]